MPGITIRTPYDQAEKAGKQLLAKATEEHHRRKETGKKDTYQAAKEAATYLVHQSKGMVRLRLDINNNKYFNYESIFGHS
jgi:hypothetical protein